MAKDRDGSINIYGSLQAKTEDGVVAYTDGIAHENEDGTKTPLDQLLKDSGGIIDVDKLPQSGWSGTVVPNEGYVEKVYFNTNLSDEEVEEILNNLTYYSGDMNSSALLATSDKILGVINTSGAFALVDVLNTTIYWTNQKGVDELVPNLGVEGIVAGWQTFDNPIEINDNAFLDLSGDGSILVGTENDKTSSLFSTTPFVYNEANINDKAIYRLKEENKDIVLEYKGTTVPNSGTIESIYFNTALTIDKVQNILNNLNWIDASALGQSGFEFYPVLAYMNGSYPYALAFKKYTQVDGRHSVGDINIAIINFANMATIQYFWGNADGGWQTFDNPYSINSTSIPSLSGISIGTQNDILSSLISTTPFEEQYGNKYTYWVYKGKWVQLLTSEDGSLGPSIVDAVETLEIDFELAYTIDEDNSHIATFPNSEAQRAYNFLLEYVNNKDIEISAKIFNMTVDGGDADDWLSNAQVRYQNIYGTVPCFIFLWSARGGEIDNESYFIRILHNPNDHTSTMTIVTKTPNGTSISGKLIFTKKKVQLLEVEVEQNVNTDNLPYTDIMDLGTLTQEQYEGRANLTITSEQFNKLKEGKTIIKVNFELSDTLPTINTIYLPLNDKTTLSLGETSIDVYVFSTNVNNNTSSYGYGISINGQVNEGGTYTASFYFTEFIEFNPSYLFLEYYGTELRIRYQTTSSAIQIDQTPTENSENLISSGGVYEALQNIGGGGGSAIVDVDVLPEEPKSDVIYRTKGEQNFKKEGTLLVSNSSTNVSRVYFNTSLSIEEIDNLLSQLTYYDFNGMQVNALYSNATGTNVIFVLKNDNYYEINHSTNIAEQQFTRIYHSYSGLLLSDYIINDTGVTSLMGLPIGAENSNLLELISMNNEFGEIENGFKYNYWVFKENKWVKLLDDDEPIIDLGIIEHTLDGSTFPVYETINFAGKKITEENFFNVKMKIAIYSTEGASISKRTFYLHPIEKVRGTKERGEFYTYEGKNKLYILGVEFPEYQIYCSIYYDNSTDTSSAYLYIDNLSSAQNIEKPLIIEKTISSQEETPTFTLVEYSKLFSAKNAIIYITVGSSANLMFIKGMSVNTSDTSGYITFYALTNVFDVTMNLAVLTRDEDNIVLIKDETILASRREITNLQYYNGSFCGQGDTGPYSILNAENDTITDNQNSVVTSSGIYKALNKKQNKITVTENGDGTVDITIPTE